MRPLPLAVAGTTGGVSGLLLNLVREVAFSDPPSTCPVNLPPVPSPFDKTVGWPLQMDWPSVAFGIGLGLLLAPLLDLVFIIRLGTGRLVRRRLASAVPGWYRVLDE